MSAAENIHRDEVRAGDRVIFPAGTLLEIETTIDVEHVFPVRTERVRAEDGSPVVSIVLLGRRVRKDGSRWRRNAYVGSVADRPDALIRLPREGAGS